MSHISSSAVDLFLTCFERTYRRVLAPGFVEAVADQNRCNFGRVVVVINNVADPAAAAGMAEARRESGEITEWHFVSNHIGEVYRLFGLSRKKLGRIHYYSDHLLVAAMLPGSRYMLHWDADIRLAAPVDWIGPSVDLLERDSRVFTANPSWGSDSIFRETLREKGPFAIGYGFSDQVFLVRKEEISQPIYNYFALPSLRYPLSHIGRIFESRVDSYMRRMRYRATYRPAVYHHPDEHTSTVSVQPSTWEETKRRVNQLVLRNILRCPIKPETWKF